MRRKTKSLSSIKFILVKGILLFLLGGSEAPIYRKLNPQALDGNISLTLHHGIWKLWEEKPIYQDLTLDLVCDRGKCDGEVWGYAPSFNKDVDHQGEVVVTPTKRAWELQVQLQVQPHPGNPDAEAANYNIELVPHQGKLIGSYVSEYQERRSVGKVIGNKSQLQSATLANHQPIQPQEHPRLLFRAQELPLLRKKAQTPYGKAIIARLETALAEKIYYEAFVPNGGYHATGHCFLSLLRNDPKSAATAWEIVQQSLAQPGKRFLEHAPIVAGVAMAYDLCYPAWNEAQRRQIARWLGNQAVKLTKGDSPKRGWNNNPWSNWYARARGASGLAALAILDEPEAYYPNSKFLPDSQAAWRLAKISERGVSRYLDWAIGDRAFGTEGDLYTTEPWVLTILPFIQAYRNVVGIDLAPAKTQWMLPQYILRSIETETGFAAPSYGRHRLTANPSLFAVGLPLVPEAFLPGVKAFYHRNLGLDGDRSFGIGPFFPYEAIFALIGYQDNITPQNPEAVWGKTLEDTQKGFYSWRNRWQDRNDFVASIYLKTQHLKGSWSFPDAGSFRIWGLGEQWAIAGASEAEPENENIVVTANSDNQGSQQTYAKTTPDGSGIVTMVKDNWLRSFAVDYSQASGTPGLFAIVDRFELSETQDFQPKTWVLNVTGTVTIQDSSFTITAPSGATMRGTFISPQGVQLSYKTTETGGVIRAVGINDFFVVLTVQSAAIPQVLIEGSGLDAVAQVGKQKIAFDGSKIILEEIPWTSSN
ncbi:MAG TPA: hypothetical protein ACFCUY_06130 [Xenococcaceae cyanobacterium]